MNAFLLMGLVAQLAAVPAGRIHIRTVISGVRPMSYGIWVPDDYRPEEPRPLVLALHPGGAPTPNYGPSFLRNVVLPALGGLRPIIVAPDCPARSWTDPVADRAVTDLLKKVMADYTIDRRRILVTGFSMGGRGTWFMASHHADLFTAAIPMAASTGDEPLDGLARVPTYVIHSRNDQVVPFAPAEQNARALEELGRTIQFEELRGLGHYDMGGYVDALKRAGRWISEHWAD